MNDNMSTQELLDGINWLLNRIIEELPPERAKKLLYKAYSWLNHLFVSSAHS